MRVRGAVVGTGCTGMASTGRGCTALVTGAVVGTGCTGTASTERGCTALVTGARLHASARFGRGGTGGRSNCRCACIRMPISRPATSPPKCMKLSTHGVRPIT